MRPPSEMQLRKLRGIATYQFAKETGSALLGGDMRISCSKKTRRIRHIYWRKRLIATLRPKDGCLALNAQGASLIHSRLNNPSNIVVALSEVAEFVKSGGDLFAKHVVRSDETLRAGDEAIVTDEDGTLLGVGRAVLTGHEMVLFKRGVAVKIRRGLGE